MQTIFKPNRKKIIFFDLNDTLTNQQKAFDHSFLETINEYVERWDAEETSIQPQQLLNQYKKEWKAKNAVLRKKNIKKESIQISCMRKIVSDIPFPSDDVFLRRFFERIRALQTKNSVLFPRVKETLHILSKTYKLGIITNGSEKQITEQLNKLDIAPLFSYKFVSRSIGHAKPSPNIFRHALQSAHIKPLQAVMVGNSWRNDIFGATRAEIDAIWVHRTNKQQFAKRKIGKENVYIIRQFQQLQQLFSLE